MFGTTKDGVEVRVGQVWRDINTRSAGVRLGTVISISSDGAEEKAHMQFSGTCRTTMVKISRMHKHASGWQLVKEAP